IINDSIVLVSTVDEYGHNRGLRPAIVDAVCDRLRPVMLTTLTTVLGLAPLLYEGSAEAEFLKPTVITLCYGLGFGVFMVLLVVPALLAAGQDLSHSLRAGRRALLAGRRGGPAFAASAALALALTGWFALTLGAQMVSGQMAFIPVTLPETGAAGLAFAVFALGAGVLTVIAYVIAALLRLTAGRHAAR
ncbi:MAG: efflux RND transporter permease subunit, partial [Rhodobacteraceae bacterium]|nr:efflux RND transporter permease subunit [Paracoccaceae bacterium]